VTNILDEVKEGNMPEVNKGLRIKGFKVSRVCQLKRGLKARPLDFTGFEGYKN